MSPFLEMKHISFSYHEETGETKALSDLSLEAEEGEFIAVVGPSGCGKSTLLSLICGLLKPEQGEILIQGKPLEENSTNIGYMLQKDHLFEWRTIFSNVTLGLEIQHKLTPQRKNQVREMMETYGLGEFAQARPSQLSGGMRQRAALIRTLALEPEMLLLDEPFSALDYQTRLQVCDDIYKIIRQEKKTAILVTHDLSEAISVGNRIYVLSSRPATVASVIPITFADQNLTPLARRNSPEFSGYFNQVWKELEDHAS